MNKIDLLTGDVDNVHTVQKDLKTLHEIFEDLQKAYDVLCSKLLTTEEDKNVAREWYESQSGRMCDFINKIGNLTTMTKLKLEEQLQKGSTISKSSNRASSRASSVSARAKERAKEAELIAKAAMLQNKIKQTKTKTSSSK